MNKLQADWITKNLQDKFEKLYQIKKFIEDLSLLRRIFNEL